MDRDSIIISPGRVLWNSVSAYSQGDVDININRSAFNPEVDGLGPIGDRLNQESVTVGFTPDGRMSPAWVAAIFTPFAAKQKGTSMLGATDQALTVHGQDTSLATVTNAFISKLPSLTLCSTKTILGAMEFTGLKGKASEITDPARLFTYVATGTDSFADTGYTTAGIITQNYTAALGAVSGLTGIETDDSGFKVDFELSLSDGVNTSKYGFIDKRFQSIRVKCSFTPLSSTVVTLLGSLVLGGAGVLGLARGGAMAGATPGVDFVITGADTASVLTLKNVSVSKGALKYSSTGNRVQEFIVETNPLFTSGLVTARYTFTGANWLAA